MAGPFFRDFDFQNLRKSSVDGGPVHFQNLSAVFPIAFFRSLLHPPSGVLRFQQAGYGKEGCLQDGADFIVQADFLADSDGVYNEETQAVPGNIGLHGFRKVGIQLSRNGGCPFPEACGLPWGRIRMEIQQESPAVFYLLYHVVFVQVDRVMAGYKISPVYKVGAADGRFSEPQVGDGQPSGFFGIILKVSLGIHIRVVADDFDGILGGTHRAVPAQSPEFTGNSVGPGSFR